MIFYWYIVIFFLPLQSQNVIATVAQLVEQRIRNAWVAGSSPASGSQRIL